MNSYIHKYSTKMNYSMIENDVVPIATINSWEVAARFALFGLLMLTIYFIKELDNIFERIDKIPLRQRRMRLIQLLNRDLDEEIERIKREYKQKIDNLPPLKETAEEEKYFEEHYNYNPVTKQYEWDENYPANYQDYMKQQQQQDLHTD